MAAPKFIPLPAPHSAVRVAVDLYAGSTRVAYDGLPADLIAAGVATAEMLAPGRKGTRRIDPDGIPFHRAVIRGRGHICIARYYPDRRLAGTLPGVSAAFREYAGAAICAGLVDCDAATRIEFVVEGFRDLADACEQAIANGADPQGKDPVLFADFVRLHMSWQGTADADDVAGLVVRDQRGVSRRMLQCLCVNRLQEIGVRL